MNFALQIISFLTYSSLGRPWAIASLLFFLAFMAYDGAPRILGKLALAYDSIGSIHLSIHRTAGVQMLLCIFEFFLLLFIYVLLSLMLPTVLPLFLILLFLYWISHRITQFVRYMKKKDNPPEC